ncbi:hypothetical protein LTR35_014366 [Friedmanniomyces endolithicus]|uniref:Uncharacterized protein n=1 Tax=Friedmanniomyces endolithicus TaxID=329885 RepID=A0AAN6FYI8_9PEZI|nr:hypothetical protein LTR35_014366 [Friedmanniomyces endolithicus]KAK0294365.1 hypothetical protein LTS00_006955 [Friedmanniomyces endolithicus]KAK0326778.1 hypothetical protein LTR82_002621 [Friedmanniomyces endolithicus]KAK1013379.1 hypothetical protein LTR54_004286 [Friedmanniomyces endolithicus]
MASYLRDGSKVNKPVGVAAIFSPTGEQWAKTPDSDFARSRVTQGQASKDTRRVFGSAVSAMSTLAPRPIVHEYSVGSASDHRAHVRQLWGASETAQITRRVAGSTSVNAGVSPITNSLTVPESAPQEQSRTPQMVEPRTQHARSFHCSTGQSDRPQSRKRAADDSSSSPRRPLRRSTKSVSRIHEELGGSLRTIPPPPSPATHEAPITSNLSGRIWYPQLDDGGEVAISKGNSLGKRRQV